LNDDYFNTLALGLPNVEANTEFVSDVYYAKGNCPSNSFMSSPQYSVKGTRFSYVFCASSIKYSDIASAVTDLVVNSTFTCTDNYRQIGNSNLCARYGSTLHQNAILKKNFLIIRGNCPDFIKHSLTFITDINDKTSIDTVCYDVYQDRYALSRVQLTAAPITRDINGKAPTRPNK